MISSERSKSRLRVVRAGRSNDPSGTDGPFVIVLVSVLNEMEGRKARAKRKEKKTDAIETRLGDLLIGLSRLT